MVTNHRLSISDYVTGWNAQNASFAKKGCHPVLLGESYSSKQKFKTGSGNLRELSLGSFAYSYNDNDYRIY